METQRLMRVVMFTLCLSAMSGLMFNFVLPDMREEFGLTTAQVSWVSSSYSLIYGVGTVLYGKLTERIQLRNLITIGLLLFAVGSLVGLFSQVFWMVLVSRCLQAVGAAAIPATAMLIPIRYIAPEGRGSAMATAFVGLSIGSALGPIVSSLVASIADWRWLFCIPLLILITIPLYRKYLKEEELQSSGQFDWLGGGLLAAAVTFLLLGVTNGSWWQPLLGLLAMGLLIIRIRTAAVPFVDPGLFRNKNYTLRLIVMFIVSGIGFSLHFLSPLLLSEVQGLSPGWVGFVMVPAAIASALLGKAGGRLADGRGNTYLFLVAVGLLLACFALLSTFTGISPVLIAVFLILGHVGQTFVMIALSNSVSLSLHKEQAGVGMGLMQMLNFISAGMASGVYGKMLDIQSGIHWNPVHFYTEGNLYSNIYLALAVLLIAIMLFYYVQFGQRESKGIVLESPN